jgi:rubrerythrin
MAEISQDMLNVIKDSITLEINGRSFYEHAAEVTHNDLGKKMFKKLAQDESEHIRAFGEMFTQALGSDEWKKYVSQQENNKSSVLNELKARIDKEAKQERAGDLEALRIGMELERKSIDHYNKAAKQTADHKAQDVFNELVKVEEFHYDMLQAQYDNVTGSGFWFDIAEFKMDGKF